MIGGGLVVPVVTRVVHMYSESGALCRGACLLQGGLVGKKRPPARTVERLIVGLWSFSESVPLIKLTNGVWKLRQKAVLLGNTVAIFHAGRVRHRRSGGESIRSIRGNIGDQQRNLLRWKSRPRQPSAFDCGKMLANGIDL